MLDTQSGPALHASGEAIPTSSAVSPWLPSSSASCAEAARSQCARAAGDMGGASTHFTAQRAMLETLALSEACVPHDAGAASAAASTQQPLQRVYLDLSMRYAPMELVLFPLGSLHSLLCHFRNADRRTVVAQLRRYF